MRRLDRCSGTPSPEFLLGDSKGIALPARCGLYWLRENGRFIFEQLEKVIEEIGAEHIVAVIMDGASANESANRLLEEG